MVSLLVFAETLLLWARFNTGSSEFQFVERHDWIPAFGIRWHVAVDGISLWLILLTTFMTPIAVYAAFGSIKTRIKKFCFAFLLVPDRDARHAGLLDLFLFYVFWELMLLPMYVLIGIWGAAAHLRGGQVRALYDDRHVLMLAAIWTWRTRTHPPASSPSTCRCSTTRR